MELLEWVLKTPRYVHNACVLTNGVINFLITMVIRARLPAPLLMPING